MNAHEIQEFEPLCPKANPMKTEYFDLVVLRTRKGKPAVRLFGISVLAETIDQAVKAVRRTIDNSEKNLVVLQAAQFNEA